jgi:hypothetical protein
MNEVILICVGVLAVASSTFHAILVYRIKRDISDVIYDTEIILEFCLEKTLEHYNETEQYEKAQECTEYLNHLRSRYQ